MPKQTKTKLREAAQQQVITALQAIGYCEDGFTAVQQVRIPTVDNPVFGGVGGKVTSLGGRLRFVRPGAPVRATVGPQTTNFYVLVTVAGRRDVDMLKQFDTLDVDRIAKYIGTLIEEPAR